VVNSKRISVTEAVSIADSIFPYAALRSVIIPQNTDGIIEVSKRQPGEANHVYGQSIVSIDQYSGKILHIKDPNSFSAGEALLNLMWPLHTGEVLGFPGRILACVTGLVPLVLYITGLIRWLQKRKAKKLKDVKRSL